MLFFALLARRFGPEKLGIFFFLFSLVSVFTVFASFGLNTLTMREVARDKRKAPLFFSNVLLLKVVLSLVSIVFVGLILCFLHYSNEVLKIGLLFSTIIIVNTIIALNDSLFKAFERFEYTAFLKIFYNVLVLFVGFFMLSKGCNLSAIILLMISAAAVSACLGMGILRKKFFRFKPDMNIDFWKSLLREGYPFVFATFTGILYARTDVFMLSKMSGDVAVGVYSAAYKIIGVYSTLPNIFIVSLFPILARKFENSKESLKDIANNAMRYLLLISFPILILSVANSKEIISLLYGSEFKASSIVFQILSIRGFTFFTNTLFGYLLFAANKQKIILKLRLITLTANIILNVLLIPKYSYIGASVATSISAMCFLGLCYLFVIKSVYKMNLIFLGIKPFVSGALMLLSLLFIKTGGGLIFDIPIAILVYFSSVIVFGGFNKSDLQMLKHIFVSAG